MASTEYCRAGIVIGHCAAIDVVRSTASSAEYCRAGGFVGRSAAVDVVRSTARSTEYCRALAVITVQQLMSSALWRVLSTAERGSSSVTVQQLMSSALRRAVLSSAERGAVIGCCVAVHVVRSTASRTEYCIAVFVVSLYAAMQL